MVRVESNRSAPIHCYTCKLSIPNGALQVVKQSAKYGFRVFHLDCWKPEHLAPYRVDWFSFDWEAKARLTEVRRWVERWNRQFEVHEELVPVQYLSKAVSTTGTALRRLLLEVFQWLNTTEMETTAAMCCKAWYHISREEEFWRTRYIADFHPAETDSQGDYRRKYIAYRLGSCWHCKKLVPVSEIQFKCKVFKQPLCKQCYLVQECHITPLNVFKLRQKVTLTTLESLGIPYFSYYGTKSSYVVLYKSKLQPYAETRRLLLLRTLDTEHPESLQARDRAKVQAFDFGRFYAGESAQVLKGVEKALVEFCGKWGGREKLRTNVQLFLSTVEAYGEK